MRFLLSVIGMAFSVAVVGVAVAWVETGNVGISFFEPPDGQPSLWGLVLPGVIMILGVFCGRVHSQLRDAPSPTRIVAVLADACRQPDLWRALFASPILFSVVYSFLEQQPGFVLALLFSFENGFFCDKILERRAAHG